MKTKFFLQGIKYSFIKIYTMKKMKLSLILLIATVAVACGQKADDTFLKPVYFPKGIYLGADPVLHLTWPTGSESIIWDSVLFKPLLFPPIAHTHDYAIDLTNKPGTIQLQEAILQLPFLSPPKKTTAEIALSGPTEGDILYDKTARVWKGYRDGQWLTFMTNQ